MLPAPAAVPSQDACREASKVELDPQATSDERYAARAVRLAFHAGRKVDMHIANVLAGYVARKQRVNRYGK